jgi:hypothetical protein
MKRPYIPLDVRIEVADRQIIADGGYFFVTGNPSRKELLQTMLTELFGDKKPELHHRPALVNRQRRRNGDYDPPANDPAFLVYLAIADHDVETRIRGEHGAHSDLALRRKNKKIARNRDPKHRKAKIAQREEYRWPSRPFPKRSKRK